MSNIWQPADTYERWQYALAMTESRDNPDALGDYLHGKPLAAGRWQMHPVFVDRWWPDSFETNDATTWDLLFEACLHNFYDTLKAEAPGPIALAIWFHLHGGKGAGWDTTYAQRFTSYYYPVGADAA